MSNQSVIWVRDALVITLSIYVVFSIAMAPWNNLKFDESLSAGPYCYDMDNHDIAKEDSQEDCESVGFIWVEKTCATGCSPVIKYPDDGYYHYKNSIVFEWNSASLGYRFTVLNSTGYVFHNENLTGVTTSTTNRLPEGNYTSFVYYRGIAGSLFGDDEPLLRNEDHFLASSSKITLVWAPVEVTYGIEIREHKTTEILIIHQGEGLTQTSYEFKDFDNGKTYSWSVYAVDSMGFVSESSTVRELNIGTTKFLAYDLFGVWASPFLFLGILMVVALQAGVFLAREETND